jgi:hypothetical protein
MMPAERKVLQFIARFDGKVSPRTADILSHGGSTECEHAIHELHMRGLIETMPFRGRGCPRRYRITAHGRDLLAREVSR